MLRKHWPNYDRSGRAIPNAQVDQKTLVGFLEQGLRLRPKKASAHKRRVEAEVKKPVDVDARIVALQNQLKIRDTQVAVLQGRVDELNAELEAAETQTAGLLLLAISLRREAKAAK